MYVGMFVSGDIWQAVSETASQAVRQSGSQAVSFQSALRGLDAKANKQPSLCSPRGVASSFPARHQRSPGSGRAAGWLAGCLAV